MNAFSGLESRPVWVLGMSFTLFYRFGNCRRSSTRFAVSIALLAVISAALPTFADTATAPSVGTEVSSASAERTRATNPGAAATSGVPAGEASSIAFAETSAPSPFYAPPNLKDFLLSNSIALVGVIGVIGMQEARADMASVGSKVVAEYDIKDPAPSVGRAVAAYLGRQYNRSIVGIQYNATRSEVTDLALAGLAAGARYVVYASTLSWGFGHFPPDLIVHDGRSKHWHVYYIVSLELVDTQQRKIVHKSICRYKYPPIPASPTLEEMFANQGAALKSRIQDAADSCASEFITKLPSI